MLFSKQLFRQDTTQAIPSQIVKTASKGFMNWVKGQPLVEPEQECIKHNLLKSPKSYRPHHPIYNLEGIEEITQTHMMTQSFSEKLALFAVKALRLSFDIGSGFDKDKMNEKNWLKRCIFLETVAGVPGMVGGMTRHMQSLRTLSHDHGLIHHLLDEAENERTHLFIFLKLEQPGRLFRTLIAISQGLFFNFYFLAYLLNPRVCHKFVGYLEEEAVHTYSMLLEQLDKGNLKEWAAMEAPELARNYYELPDNASMRDMILYIRADESIHRDLNHKFAEIL